MSSNSKVPTRDELYRRYVVGSMDACRNSFAAPPTSQRPMPLWWINAPMTAQGLRDRLQKLDEHTGFGGVAVLPYNGIEPEFLSDEYWQLYGELLDECKRRGMHVIFCDELGFPSGWAAGRLEKRHPESVKKFLGKSEDLVSGPTVYERAMPSEPLMAAVAVRADDPSERIDLAHSVAEGHLRWEVPAGRWRVMLFTLHRSHKRRALADFMSADAVSKFVELTYGAAYERFPAEFGSTVFMCFWDDVGLSEAEGFRMWTSGFNDAFRRWFGRDPSVLYPALWEDIGEETDAARYALFACRGRLFVEGFCKTVQDWCRGHGILSAGHVPGPYITQPADMGGDNILFQQYNDVPLCDLIFHDTHGRSGFKLTSSAAFSFDRPMGAVEIYGAFRPDRLTRDVLYARAMELFVRGQNLLIPHGAWYDPNKPKIVPPPVQAESPLIGEELPAYNTWAGRCSLLLRGGRHVADIGMLYPIASLLAWYLFYAPDTEGWGGRYGPPENDFLDLSDALTGTIRRDFTFLHPEVLEGKCRIADGVLRMENEVNWEEYRVLILPAGRVIHFSSLQKIKDFFDAGGTVIATAQLPFRSAEFGHDQDVRAAVRHIFGVDATQPGVRDTPVSPAVEPLHPEYATRGATPIVRNVGAGGGRAFYLPEPSVHSLAACIDEAVPVADVAFEGAPVAPADDKGMLSYLHKVKDGRHIYYLANSLSVPFEGSVRLRGRLVLEQWDPCTGRVTPVELDHQVAEGGIDVTHVELKLDAVSSTFLVGELRSEA